MTERRTVFVSHPAAGLGRSTFPIVCEVVDGRIGRCLPFYIPDDVRLYEIRTRHGSFTRPRKEVQMPLAYAWKQRVESPSRIRYPLIRKGWKPGKPNTAGRGEDEYRRIGWDEAIDIVVDQIGRVRERFGMMEPVMVLADGHGQSGYLHSLHFWGHYLFDKMREHLDTGWWTQLVRNPDSWEGYYWGAKHVWGFDETLGEPYQDAVWDDVLEHCEMVVLSGNDPEATGIGMSGSSAVHMPRWLKRAGIKIVAISPDLNHAGAVHADTWIPIRPNTDAALYLALAHVWIVEGRYQTEYVRDRTVGFDAFRAHVLGEDDGCPKTPEWAAEVTGIEPHTIRALAREWAAKRTSLSVYFGGPKIRGTYSHLAGRTEAYILAMQGIGLPGRQFLRTGAPSFYRRRLAQVPRYPEVDHGGIAMSPLIEYAIGRGPRSPSHIPRTLVADALLHPPVTWRGTTAALADTRDQFAQYRFPPTPDHPGIRLLWNENGSQPGSWGNGWKWLEALRQPQLEFVVGIHPWMENDIAYSDVVLPAQTVFEHEDLISGQRSDTIGLFYQEAAIEPIGESLSDYEIHKLIAHRLGLDEAAFPPAEDILREAFETTAAHRRLELSWEEFKARRAVVYDAPTWDEWVAIKADEGIGEHEGGLAWFASAGEGLQTRSGKIEFVSGWIEEHAPASRERPPLATWIQASEREGWDPGSDDRLAVVTNHPRFRFHVQGDDVPWIRELAKIPGPGGYLYEPCWIHPDDAARRGIESGDVLSISNERGEVLVAARVTARIIPGAVLIEHGAILDPAVLDGRTVDRGGCINLIAPWPRDKYAEDEEIEVPEMNVSGFLVRVRTLDSSDVDALAEMGPHPADASGAG